MKSMTSPASPLRCCFPWPAGLFLLWTLVKPGWGAPLDQLQFRPVSLAQTTLNSVAYGDGRFVAVGANGAIVTSADGLNWTKQRAPRSTPLLGITYGNGQFVIVGLGGTILTSSNGMNWAQQSVGRAAISSMNLQAITYGADQFVAVGDRLASPATAAIVTSPDGVTWTEQTSNSSPSLTSIAYGNGRYVATGGTSLLISDDSVKWSVRAVSGSQVAFGNGVFVLNAPLRTSTDGIHWTLHKSTSPFNSFGYAGGEFIGFTLREAVISMDGAVWSAITLPGYNGLNKGSIAYGNGRYVAVGASTILVSDDGLNWDILASPSSIFGPLRSLAYQAGHFILAGNSYPAPVWFSEEGLAWSAASLSNEDLRGGFSPVTAAAGNNLLVLMGRQSLTTFAVARDGEDWTVSTLNLALNALSFGNGQFIAVGDQGLVAASTNGLVWNPQHSVATNRLAAVGFWAGQFVAVGDRGTVLTSQDGQEWFLRPTPKSTPLQAVTYGNGSFVAVGSNGTILRSTNAVDWTAPSSGTSSALQHVAYGNELFVAVGTAGVILASTDGLNWIRKSTATTDSFSGVAFGAGKFLAAGLSTLWEADLSAGQLSAPALGATRFTFSISGEIGRVYQVEATSKLLEGPWVQIGSVTNQHLLEPFSDSQFGESRFYRLRHDP